MTATLFIPTPCSKFKILHSLQPCFSSPAVCILSTKGTGYFLKAWENYQKVFHALLKSSTKPHPERGSVLQLLFAFRRKLYWALYWASRALPSPPSLLHRVHLLFGWQWNSPDKTDAIFSQDSEWTEWGCTVQDSKRGRGPANVQLCFACVWKKTETGQFHHLPVAYSQGMKPKSDLAPGFRYKKRTEAAKLN